MPDQIPVTDDDRIAHQWESKHRNDGNVGLAAVARAIRAHVPAPPATLADELREWGVRPFDGLNWTRFHNLADRVENVVKEGREYASKADQWEVTAKRLASERDEARDGRDAHRDLANRLSAEMERMKDSHRIAIQERDEWGEENGELRAEVELLAAQIDRLIAEMDKARNGDWLKEDLPAPADVPSEEIWLIRTNVGQAMAGVRNSDGSWSVLAHNGFAREDDLDDEEVTLVSRLVPDVRRVIDRPEDLDKLPEGAIILDHRDGISCQKIDGLWKPDDRDDECSYDSTVFGPVTVIHEPEVTA